ncbi:hypothetical protein JQS43_11705 [Natronosporangium hydrolyticum]|uniref:Uncharacterized protein n=1 Tax=Natronosporangium hydrolyticum TaxID=2811111 RepID=A0A895YH57_9ACTN|nr:VLRF1 family aeRF1-type release factor [Natronosporangium hydrolyticum]QSB16881.1 hypothetical protein JQS43_11705 [Natronosporangium hydrolyticum]
MAELTDEVGVLSIYVNRDPQARAEGSNRPPWEVRLRQQLSQLRDRVKEQGPREHWKALEQRLDELGPDLDGLLDPTSSGQGGALFATVAGGETHRFAVQRPLPDQVVLEPRAYIRPLVTVWSTAGPAGAVSVSEDELKLVDLRFGYAEPVGSIPVRPESEVTRTLQGPAASNPQLGQHSAPQHDLYERREDEKLLRFLRTLGPHVAEHVSNREWGYLALTGDATLVQAVQESLPAQLPAEVVPLEFRAHSLTPPKLAATVEPALGEARQRHHRELAERARSNALSANAGAYGLGETLGALQEARVAHLLLAADGRWEGGRTRDGFLAPAGEIPPGFTADDLIPEPHLAERMIERAFLEGADVTMLDGDEAEPLADAGGVGAILRW